MAEWARAVYLGLPVCWNIRLLEEVGWHPNAIEAGPAAVSAIPVANLYLTGLRLLGV